MTPKERFISALHFKEPDDLVPAWEIEFHLYEQLLGRQLLFGARFDALSDIDKEKATYYNAEMYIEAATKLEQAAICAPPGYWEKAPGIPAVLWIRELKWRREFVKALKKISGDEFLIIGISDSTVGIPTGDHLDSFVSMIYEQPDEFMKLTKCRLEKGIEEGERLVEAGVDALLNASDIAFNSGCFFTPGQVDDYIGPFLAKWAQHFKKEGIYTIFHTDGDITKIMDKLIATGISAIQCIDPIAGMNIVKLKEEYQGKITLIGNVDTRTLELGTFEEIDTECKYILEGCKKGGGFVFGACNAIHEGIPVSKYLKVTEALRRYGCYE